MKQYLQEQLQANQFVCSEEQIDKIVAFHRLLCRWNEKMNLTSILEEKEAVQKHYLDSLQLLKTNLSLQDKSMIDVGTGAGFPGIPLAVFCNSSQFTLLDSLQKRVSFLQFVQSELDIRNVNPIHMRSEDAAHNPIYREKFDYALSRAVAKLSVLNEYLLPFVKLNGYFIAYKANLENNEINAALKSLYMLGGEAYQQVEIHFHNSSLTRKLILSKKIQCSPKSFPRKAGIPQKNPIE